MPKIRVLVVDDSVVIRKVLSEELNADPAIEVAGTAANGKIALARLHQSSFDLIILDVEMPDMNGLETLVELRKTHAKIPVIMFSSLTERGAEVTLDALSLGATDYFTKPAGPGGLEESRIIIREELIPQIKSLCRLRVEATPMPRTEIKSSPQTPLITPPSTTQKPAIVAIGVSTGGPNALAELFAGLPADFPVPIVIVQHMPATFTRLLAERLTNNSKIKVCEATSGMSLQPGHAYIAPGNYHMIVVKDGAVLRAALHQDPPENSCRPSVDPLFRSVAKAFGGKCLAVVMTGMGQDGLRGCEQIRAAGGKIVVQDEATSVVWGMPGFVAKAGLADKILPLAMISSEIVRRARAV